MYKSKISLLLATAAVAAGAFGSASVANAGIKVPDKHPDGIGIPQKHPDIIGVLKHPDIIGVLKHSHGRLQKHPDMIQKFEGGNS